MLKHARIVLVGILAVGFLIRSVGLTVIPPALNSDELLKAFDGASVYRTGMDHHGHPWPLFFEQSGEYSPPLYIYSAGLLSAIWGINEYTVRLPSVFWGTLSIALTYLFVSAFAEKKIALIAAALVSLSPWNVHYSRIGWEAIMLPPLQLAALWRFLVWSKTQRLHDLLIAASVFGLTIYAYPVARLSTILILAGLMGIYGKALWKKRTHTLAAGLVFLFWLLPYFLVLMQNYEAMQARWRFISLFNRNDSALLFLKQYWMHLSPDFLFIWGNPGSMHSLFGGMTLGVLFPFFLLGLYRLLLNRTREDVILLFWLFTFAIPSSMTYDRYDPTSIPSSLRAINGVPVVEIISTLGIGWVLACKSGRTWRRTWSATVGCLVVFNAAFVLWDAVYRYPLRSAESWQYGLREAVQYMETHKDRYDRLIVSHKVRLHPVALACFSGRQPGPFDSKDFPQYILPFYHYAPVYQDFGMKDYQQFGLISRWYTLARGKNLLLAVAGEIEGKPLQQFFKPDGKPAYEVFETNR